MPAALIPLEETPVLTEAESTDDGVTMYIPAEHEEEAEYSVPQVLAQVE